MPEFILDMGAPDGAKAFQSLDAFTQGYVEAAFFTDTGYPEDDDLENASVAEIAPDSLAGVIQDCAAWQATNADLLEKAYSLGYDEAQAGRDYWFTRNGHGVGFWDREILDTSRDLWRELGSPRVDDLAWEDYQKRKGESLGEQLANRCRYQTVDLYRGDDGLIYFG